MSWDFENVAAGQIPKGWEIESTNPEGPLATWQVIEVASATSRKKVFGMTNPNHSSTDTFNICWNNFVLFLNGVIEGYLNDQKLLEVTDQTFVSSGGIGLWTKADAVTVFDDLAIHSGK